MIKYKLMCKDCDLKFDSWFASSDEFEKLKKKGFLNCHQCNSKRIEKSLMTPQLMSKFEVKDTKEKNLKFREINKKIREYQKFIKNNFEYVGKNFAYEARSIHYGNKKKEKRIYGSATTKEIHELKEEGINAEIIPWVEEKKN